MIEVNQLTRHYGPLRAVDGLSFVVEPGTVLGFLGPNGAGKSTTMKMLTGCLRPDSGHVRINGHDIVSARRRAQQCAGYLPEGSPLYPEMTVADFLSFIAHMRGLRGARRDQRLAYVVEALSLRGVLAQRVATLSKGFARRVGLAQAIVHDPPVLVLDEPTDGLDPNQKRQVRHLIRGMASDRIVIISTHVLEEVEAVCNRVLVIDRGRCVLDDTPLGMLARSRYCGAVSLTVDQPERVASALGGLDEVAEVELRAGRLTALPSGRGELFDAVSALIREHGWPVHQLVLESGRLDEVFAHLTQAEAKRHD